MIVVLIGLFLAALIVAMVGVATLITRRARYYELARAVEFEAWLLPKDAADGTVVIFGPWQYTKCGTGWLRERREA